VGEAANETADGLGGHDTLSGFGGADTLSGGESNDILYGHSEGATESDIVSSIFVSGLSSPVAGATAPGDEAFLYVLEKNSGVIWRIDADTGARTTFLDIPQAGDVHARHQYRQHHLARRGRHRRHRQQRRQHHHRQ
jgi:Ca2+-binding RTX toxin-like protein